MKYYFEVVKYEQNLPAKVLLQNKPGWRCNTNLHWHKELELVYMEKGHLDININGRDLSVNDGEMYFVNSEDTHISSAPDPNAGNNYVVVLLSVDFMKSYYKKLASVMFNVNDNLQAKQQIITCLKNLKHIYEVKDEFYQLDANCEILKIYKILLSQCVVYKKNNIPTRVEENFNYAKKAIEYIGINYKDEITLNDISAYVGLTPTYFSKYFKNITECNFTQFLNSIRLEHTLNEMFYENSTVTDAAFNNGFANVKSFINLCKKVYGCTPTEYKRKINEKI